MKFRQVDEKIVSAVSDGFVFFICVISIIYDRINDDEEDTKS